MRNNTIYVVDLFKTVVESVAIGLETPVYYQYGRPPEVINSLTDMGKNQKSAVKRYPLVYLVMPFDEKKDTIEQDITVDLHLIIIANTKEHWLTSERYENIFKPILYPVYDELLYQIARSTFFQPTSEYQISHTKTDWPHYGSKGNFANDFIDAIDITNLKLRVNFINCINNIKTIAS